MTQPGLIVDQFAGPGGWSEGLRLLGLRDVGLEWDSAACRTRAAAGHLTIQCDVAQYPTAPLVAHAWGYIGSPPCTLYSNAGTGIGRLVLDLIANGIVRIFAGADCRREIRDAIYPVALAERTEANDRKAAAKRWAQERIEKTARDDAYCAALVLEPARFISDAIRAGGPLEWIALEQVPSVQPLWDVYATELRRLGWSVWTGIANAADHGVPQTRRRAVFAASRVRTVTAPEPTHYDPKAGFQLWGDPWVSMAEALTLDAGRMVNTRGERTTPGGNEFSADGPSWALTSKTRSWVLVSNTQANAAVRHMDEPASTLFFGHRGNAVNWTDGQEKRPLEVWEASVLQSMPADYPWHGSKTKQFEQIGNLVPALLAAHVIASATGLPIPAARPAAASCSGASQETEPNNAVAATGLSLPAPRPAAA